ncbi:unnamed protein product, partial [Mesorhabditis spiculigera]
MARNGGQFLTADSSERRRMQMQGWNEVAPIGMCVRQMGQCGARSPLLEARKNADDFIYMTDRGEFQKFLAKNRDYRASPQEVVCWIW